MVSHKFITLNSNIHNNIKINNSSKFKSNKFVCFNENIDNNINIGITINDMSNQKGGNLFCNGINQHILSFYNYFENHTNATPYLVSNTIDIKNHKFRQIDLNDYDNIAKLKYVIIVGLRYPVQNYNILKTCCVSKKLDVPKMIYISLGNRYFINLMKTGMDNKNEKDSYIQYDEVWLSDHYYYSKDYYEVYFNSPVYRCPYIWNPDFIQKSLNHNDLLDIDKINVAIMEPNLKEMFYTKNCIYPIIICNKACEYIDNVKVFCSHRIKDNDYFKKFALNTILVKEKKISFEARYPFPFIFSKFCNVLVSFNRENELNYLYLEALLFGIPLIHNSKCMKDYGYYFEDYDVDTASKHIKNLKERGFNRSEYIEKNKALIYKYSIQNPEFQHFIINRLGCDYHPTKYNNHKNIDNKKEKLCDLFNDEFVI